MHAIVDVAIDPLPLQELLETLLERLKETLHADTVTILLREGDELVARASRGLEAEVQISQVVPVGRGIAGGVAATRTPVVLDDVRAAPEVWSPLLFERVRSLLAVPLVHGEELIGVLHAGTEAPRDLHGDLVLLELVATRAASAIARTRAEEARARDAARGRLLGDLAHALSTGLEAMDQALQNATEQVAELVGDGCVVYILSGDPGVLQTVAAAHRDPETLELIREAVDGGAPVTSEGATLLHTAQTSALFDLSPSHFEAMLSEEQRLALAGRMTVFSMINVPLRSRGQVLGVVSLFRTDPDGPRYGEVEQAFIEEFASRAAVGIDNARLYREAHEARQRFRALLDSSRIGFAARDRAGRIVEANRAYASMVGFPEAAQVIGTIVEDLVSPDDSIAARERYERIFRGEVDRLEHDYDHVRPDGSVIHARVSTSLARGADGEPLYTLSLVEDMTERYQLEEQLRESQKMEALGRFAGAIAHDFNNVLTAITGSSALIAAELEPSHPLQTEAEAIRTAADRAAALTRQLLTFSRRQIVARESVSVSRLVHSLAPLLQRLLGEDIELVLDLCAEGSEVRADHSQLEQVIVNLAANARDAMPYGGRLAVEVTWTDVDSEFAGSRLALEPGRYVLLAITDTGQGIDGETQRHIFEPFFTTKPPGHGSGLGLSTVFGIVRQTGGAINVYSEPGHGTTFRVYLPASGEPAAAVPPPVGPADVPAAGVQTATILVVDDEDAVRRIIQRLLERAGYTVLGAEDGRRAIELAAEHPAPIDLLITDIVLPGISGPEIAAEVAALRGDIRVIYSSGYPGEEVARRGLDPSASFLEKPFAPEALIQMVTHLLDGRG